MNPDTVFITLLTCAYLCIAVLGLRTVLRDARTRRVRERLIADRYRPGRGDL
jgi:predicted small integral membrane protein